MHFRESGNVRGRASSWQLSNMSLCAIKVIYILKASWEKEVRSPTNALARKEQFLFFEDKGKSQLVLNTRSCYQIVILPVMVPYRIATWGHK